MFTREQVKRYMIDHDGVTLKNGDIVEYLKGYQVAISKHDEMRFSDIDDALDYMAMAYRMRYIGAWLDNGVWVVDINQQWVNNINHAIQLGIDNDQNSIWDWKNFCEIPLAEHKKIMAQYGGKK